MLPLGAGTAPVCDCYANPWQALLKRDDKPASADADQKVECRNPDRYNATHPYFRAPPAPNARVCLRDRSPALAPKPGEAEDKVARGGESRCPHVSNLRVAFPSRSTLCRYTESPSESIADLSSICPEARARIGLIPVLRM